MALLLAGCSALLYGIADFSGGFAAGRSRLLSVLVLSQLLGTLVVLAALPFLSQGQPSLRDLLWGFLAGLTGSMGLFMLYGGIARSIVAVVSPTSAVVGAIIPVLSGLLLGDRPSAYAILGSLLCLPAILMLTWERGTAEASQRSVKTALGYGVLAGLGFGVFFTTLSRAGSGSGVWPLLAAQGRLDLGLPPGDVRDQGTLPGGAPWPCTRPGRRRRRHGRQHPVPAGQPVGNAVPGGHRHVTVPCSHGPSGESLPAPADPARPSGRALRWLWPG